MFESLIDKVIGIGAVVLVVGGIILAQHTKINSQARTIAELRLDRLLLSNANKDQAEKIDKLTQDQADFAKRATTAEEAVATARATVITKTETIIKRITTDATPSDNQPVTPALRSALGVLREQRAGGNSGGPAR